MSEQPQSYVEEARRGKLNELRERGIAPFAYGYRRTHTAVEAVEAYSLTPSKARPSMSAAGAASVAKTLWATSGSYSTIPVAAA